MLLFFLTPWMLLQIFSSALLPAWSYSEAQHRHCGARDGL